MKNKKGFITAVVVIVSFGLGVVALLYRGKSDGLDLLAVVLFLFTGWYATKFKFGKV